ncbi:MAG: DNA-processing protein DprA [Halieaceae bacterium]|nr:DNA-processing protein DprA [Halieaceae bacterium]
MDTDQLRHWLTLAHLPELPAASLRGLMSGHADSSEILQLSDRDWLRAGASRAACRARRQWQRGGRNHPVRRAVERALAVLEQQSARLLVLGQPQYPALLAEIHDPPPLLYAAGRPEALAQVQFAVVGSRRCSAGSARAAGLFAAGLVDAGFSVCSGMALGIDGAAHRGALERDGPTVAVLGTGIDVCYPRRHADLRRAILESGALVSELNPGAPPRRDQFPRRNRLISGLSVGVLVAEANLRSGSLITARLALEQNREVFALPHSIFDPGGRGCHQLLREGACLAETAADVLADTVSLRAAHRELSTLGPAPATGPLAGLGFDPVSVDELVAAGLGAADEVLVALQQLELDGEIEQQGGLYSRKVC